MRNEQKKRRIEESILRELGRLLLIYSHQAVFMKITLTAVKVAADLSSAKVFFSVFDGVSVPEVTKVLQQEAKGLRKMLAQNLNLRLTPKLHFVYDESIQRGRRLTALIDAALASDENKPHET